MGSLQLIGAEPGPSEAQRLTAAADGDPAAVRWLLDEVAPVVYGFLYSRLGGDQPAAEDLLQETLMEAVASAAGFRGEARVTTWMCVIARRRLARHYEQERRAEVTRSRLQAVREETPASDELERRDAVTRALGRLAPLHRQVLVLKYLDGQSVADIAQAVGRTRVQVQSLLQRAREGLRRELEAADD